MLIMFAGADCGVHDTNGPKTCVVRMQILTPEQTARCLVRSYPWYPDSLTICTYVAAEMGDKAAMAMIHRIPASPTSSLQHSQSGSLDSS